MEEKERERQREHDGQPEGDEPGDVDVQRPHVPGQPGQREHELLQRRFPGPDGDGFLAEDLGHRGDRVRIVAELVEVDGPGVLHEAAGIVRRLQRVHDGVGIVEVGRALQHVGDDEDRVVGVAGVRVERLAVRALLVFVGDLVGPRVLEVRPRVADHRVLDVILEDGDLAGFVEAGAAGADDAQDVEPLLADLRQQELGAGRPRDRRDHVGLQGLGLRDLGGEIRRRLRPRDDVVLQQRPGRLGDLVGGQEAARLALAEEVVAVHQHHPLGRHLRLGEDLGEVLHGLAPERRRRRKVAIDVLDLLLALLYRLGHVGGDRIGRGDVDEERHALLLGHRHHRVRAAGVEGPEQHLGALVDDALGLDAAVLGLRLRVADEELQLEPALALDATRRVHRLDRHLGAESARLPGLGQRAGHRMHGTDLERLGLRARRAGPPDDGGAADGDLEERATGESRHTASLNGARIILRRARRAGARASPPAPARPAAAARSR